MAWLSSVAATTDFESVLGLRPELLTRYRAFYAGLWDAAGVPRRTLELCRLRIAAIHDCAQEWQLRDTQAPMSDAELDSLQRDEVAIFSAREQAALQIAALMPYQHHSITDAQVARLQPDLTPAGVVALLTALAFFDVSCRLKLTLEIAAHPGALSDLPLRDSALA